MLSLLQGRYVEIGSQHGQAINQITINIVTFQRNAPLSSCVSDIDVKPLKIRTILAGCFQVYSGQIVGIYDETKFMWNPTELNTITLFTCTNATQSLASFRLDLNIWERQF